MAFVVNVMVEDGKVSGYLAPNGKLTCDVGRAERFADFDELWAPLVILDNWSCPIHSVKIERVEG